MVGVAGIQEILDMQITRALKISLVVFLVGVLVVVALVSNLSKHDRVRREFSTYREAVESGAIEIAAIPTFLPKSATNIKSDRDLDANTSVVTFDFGNDFEEFLQHQKTADVSAAAGIAATHAMSISSPHSAKYFPLLSSEAGEYHGSLLVDLERGKALYVEPPVR
jgi:hypothetical protein